MNRRGFLGTLLAVPVAGIAVALAAKKGFPSPIGETVYFDKPFKPWDSRRYRKVGSPPELAMMYGGSLRENIVQSTARDLYMEALQKGWHCEEDAVILAALSA